jgi:hypothetical protein
MNAFLASKKEEIRAKRENAEALKTLTGGNNDEL